MVDEVATPVAAPAATVTLNLDAAKGKTLADILAIVSTKNLYGLAAKSLSLLIDVKLAAKAANGAVTITLPREYILALQDLAVEGIKCGAYADMFDDLIDFYASIRDL